MNSFTSLSASTFLLALLFPLCCVGDVTLYTVTMGDPNQVNVFSGSTPGDLTFVKSVSTGRAGTNATSEGIQSQNPIVVFENYLFVVNPADNSVSLFSISPSDPTNIVLLDTESTYFDWPNSIGVIVDYVCVVTSGFNNGFRCYFYNASGLLPLPSWDRPFNLSLTTPPVSHTGPAQISFTPDYDGIVVSNKGANPPIFFFTWDEGNGPSEVPVLSPIQGGVPFGFTFAGEDLILTDASPLGGFGGVIEVDLQIIPTPLVTFGTGYFIIAGQDATCWISYSSGTGYLYAANAASSTVSVISFDDVEDTFSSIANLTYNDQSGFTTNTIATYSDEDYLFQYAGGNIISVQLSDNTRLQTFSAKNGANGVGVAVYIPVPSKNPTTSTTTTGSNPSTTTGFGVKMATVSNVLAFLVLVVCFFF